MAKLSKTSTSKRIAPKKAAEKPARSSRPLGSRPVASRVAPANAGEKHTRKADHVARDLLRQITKGQLPVFSVLPKEDVLAATYGVNRGVIREAVKLLEVHRLVEPVRKRGTMVLPPLRSMSPEVLLVLLVPRPGDVDVGVLRSFLEVRAKLDVDMTQAAAANRTQEDIATLRSKMSRLATLIDEPREYVASVHDLTATVARTTKNPVYEMLSAFNSRVVTELEQSLVTTRPPSLEHVAGLQILVELIASGDQEGARAAVTAFHQWATPRILASAALASGKPLSVVNELSSSMSPTSR